MKRFFEVFIRNGIVALVLWTALFFLHGSWRNADFLAANSIACALGILVDTRKPQ